MPDQPALFDVPCPEAAAHARSGRGRTRETYSRTVVADVTVHDEAALRAAALRVLDGGLTVVIPASPHAEEYTEDDLPDPRDEVTTSAAAALEWCIEPTTGLWPLLEAGAARIVKVDLHVDEQTTSRHRVQWTVAIKLDDAPAARELALAACPATEVEARAEIERSLAAVWRWAASPYAPLAEVPGITWAPVRVVVEQIMARSR